MGTDVSFARSGFDLVIAIRGTTDKLIVKDWFAADSHFADIVGIGPPVRQVYSPGDLLALLGLAVVGAEATRPRREAYTPKHAASGNRKIEQEDFGFSPRRTR